MCTLFCIHKQSQTQKLQLTAVREKKTIENKYYIYAGVLSLFDENWNVFNYTVFNLFITLKWQYF